MIEGKKGTRAHVRSYVGCTARPLPLLLWKAFFNAVGFDYTSRPCERKGCDLPKHASILKSKIPLDFKLGRVLPEATRLLAKLYGLE